MLALAVLLLASGCGKGPRPITFDSTVPTTPPEATTSEPTTSAPSSTGEAGASESVWVDATANLAGLTSECGTVSLVSANGVDNLVGVAKNGLWIGTPDDQWRQLGQGSGSAVVDNRAQSIVFDPKDPTTTFWESGAHGGGVFRTTDGGSTFQRLGNVESADGLGVDFTDDLRQTLVAGLHEQPRVLRSGDGGQSWQDISSGLPPGVGFASFPYVIDRNTYLLGTRSGTASAVLRTVDAGATWSVVHQGGVSGPMLHSPSDGNFYWLLEDGHGVITSSDGGVTWTEADASGPAGGSAGGLVELPDGRFASLGTLQIVVSSDHGASWEAVGPTLPFTPNGMTYSPSHQAFYIWHFDCDPAAGVNLVSPQSILRLDTEA